MYSELFSRNIGVISQREQDLLAQARVAIAGLGGVGGAYAITLARLGVNEFHIADMDIFNPVNMNRQYGATLANFGRKKTDVIKEMILSINPGAKVLTFDDGVTPANVDAFLKDVHIVMDGLDFYALDARRLLFPASEKKKLHVVTSGPLGMTTTLHVFGPGAMPFEKYFDLARCATPEERLIAFSVGVGPAGLHLGHVDLSKVDFENHRAPSIGTAIQLCAGLACTEALRILIGRKSPFLAPRYFQFDPVKLRIRKGYLLWGNRHPLQRLKRWFVARMLARAREVRNPL
ncbi:MAG TPA: hypothetical protein DCS07_04815 [Bdellovibrionales bacterium]|nr:MAG: hypothetical protein A2Z97_07545 [Bdellovibrionales bacterium GWB1_52_6]OFZ04734.1 MAG: hypothetical protein A2X97_13490 [Bdellovibrionales bacterium GWA1_52_35]OFZ36117.1 MAG: hypothetical protein A2070_11580 [Bdellovibrionales bacterium GWC1_52_8]HAR41941.1 hypothetical protein [Bdellovibrionales bacterium]HCM39547.1 hypothetical protein [Bdellovibrionales bacterium]